jgi:hypothetical protein
MRLLFCCELFKPGQPDPDYAREVSAAEEAGLAWDLIDFEALVEGNVALRATGDWIIVELGDGQVSGLPDQADVTDFYRRLSAVGPTL